MTTQLPDEFIQECLDDIDKLSVLYATAKAEMEGLREDRKITKSQLMLVAEAEGVKGRDRQEVFAYTHPTYGAIVRRLKVAIRESVRLEYQLKLAELRWESWRSINANQRQALR